MATSKQRKKRKKKSSYWSPAAVTGRVVWGHGGFKGVVRRCWQEWTSPRAIKPARPNPNAGKLAAAGARQCKDGMWKVNAPTTSKPMSARKRIEQMQARIAAESDRYAKHLEAQGRPRSTSQAERTLRKSNGRLNGSRPDPAKADRDDAKRYAAAMREYRQAAKNAEVASKHAEQLLEWDRRRR